MAGKSERLRNGRRADGLFFRCANDYSLFDSPTLAEFAAKAGRKTSAYAIGLSVTLTERPAERSMRSVEQGDRGCGHRKKSRRRSEGGTLGGRDGLFDGVGAGVHPAHADAWLPGDR
jgi:hypothetical protein